MNKLSDWATPARPEKKAFDRKAFFKTFLTTGLAFGLWMAIVFGFVGGWQMAIPAGITAGLFFGLSMAGFTAVMGKKMAGQLALHAGEEILKEGPANHFFKGEGVGGWLTLTSERLQFTSHKINIQVHTLDPAAPPDRECRDGGNSGSDPERPQNQNRGGRDRTFCCQWPRRLGRRYGQSQAPAYLIVTLQVTLHDTIAAHC